MRISILGCGWLGFPLAQHLYNQKYEVKGSTTSPDKLLLLKQAGLMPFLITLPESFEDTKTDPFWNTDILFLNIPPGRNRQDVETEYPALVKKITEKALAHSISWIIFASSTSVYGKEGGLVCEEDAAPGKAVRPSGNAILKAEQILRKSTLDITILRFGGLYGYERHPVHHLSGKKNLDGAARPVNLIHQTDCVQIVDAIISQKKRNEIYNAVSDGHPPRKEFYQSAARHFGLPLPGFRKDQEKNYRVVSNQKLKSDLHYTFLYPNPMDHTP